MLVPSRFFSWTGEHADSSDEQVRRVVVSAANPTSCRGGGLNHQSPRTVVLGKGGSLRSPRPTRCNRPAWDGFARFNQ